MDLKMKSLFLSATLLLILSNSAHAAFQMTDLGFLGGLEYGYGKTKNKNLTIPSRAMTGVSGFVMPGYKFDWGMPGLFLEYRYISQQTATGAVNNQNLKGSEYLMGVAVTVPVPHYSQFQLLGGFDFWGKYFPSKKSISGEQSVYRRPLGGRILLGYKLTPLWMVNISYHTVYYSQQSLSGSRTDLWNNKLHEQSVRMGATFTY